MLMKRLLDFFIALFLLIATLPVLTILLVLISIFIDYPPIYTSVRIGIHNKPFLHFKLKSLLPGEEKGRIFFEQDRLTGLGMFIRRYHLDEIPELILILQGKMSFVGPRPLPGMHLSGYNPDKRHAIKPGYTGTAQLFLLKKGYLPRAVQNKLDCQLTENLTVKRYIQILTATLICLFHSNRVDISPSLTEERRNYPTPG